VEKMTGVTEKFRH